MKFNWSLMTLILIGKMLPVFKHDKTCFIIFRVGYCDVKTSFFFEKSVYFLDNIINSLGKV